MKLAWHDAWGGARGVVTRLAPETRLVVACALVLACLISPVATGAGSALSGATCGAWVLSCRPPWRVLWSAVLLGMALFLPFFLLTPWLEAGAGSLGRASVPWTIFLRGSSCLVVSLTAASTLSASELREALLRLPAPAIVTMIVTQIVHQVPVLVDETRRIAAAMAVRAATGRGVPSWRVARALPLVWLPRVLERSERVAVAMTLRGYCESSGDFRPARRLDPRDGVGLTLAILVMVSAVALRWLP